LATDIRRLALDQTLTIFGVLSGLTDDFGAGDEMGLGAGEVDKDFDRGLIPAVNWVIALVGGGLATASDSRTLVLVDELVLVLGVNPGLTLLLEGLAGAERPGVEIFELEAADELREAKYSAAASLASCLATS